MRAMLLMLLIEGSSSLMHSPLRFGAGQAARGVRMVSTSTVVAPAAPAKKMHDWEVHKFGGASLATAALYVQCSDLLISESKRDPDKATPTMAVVSAKGGVTDRLIAVVNAALHDGIDEASRLLQVVTSEQIEVIQAISTPEVASQVAATIRADEEDMCAAPHAPQSRSPEASGAHHRPASSSLPAANQKALAYRSPKARSVASRLS